MISAELWEPPNTPLPILLTPNSFSPSALYLFHYPPPLSFSHSQAILLNPLLSGLTVCLELAHIHYDFFSLSFFPAIALFTPMLSFRNSNIFRDNFLDLNCQFPLEGFFFFVPPIAASILPRCVRYPNSLLPNQFRMSCANYNLETISIEPNQFPFAGLSS